MAINWPDTLATEMAERRCIIFIGAGVSMASVAADGRTRPPGWGKFLGDALPLLPRSGDRTSAKKLIKKERFLDAAEVVAACIDPAVFTDYLRTTFIDPHFKPADIHRVILDLDPKIIITTNYDEIYDLYCRSGSAISGYNIAKYYDRFVVENIRSRLRLVIKAHGCVSDPTKVVLSRSSYYKARRDNPGFYSVLDSLFLTNTLLFVGCSLTDPDIQLVLENANIAAPSSHPHYALVEKMQHESLKSAIKLAHNIELLEYPVGKHDQVLEALKDLRLKVNLLRRLSP